MSFEERVKIYNGQTSYTIEICGLHRELPICQVGEDIWIASNHQLVLGRDREFTEKVGKELAKRIKKYKPEIILTAEAKSLPLAYKIAEELDIEMTVARKSRKAYMKDYLSVEIKSITTRKPQLLILELDQSQRLYGKRVALVDDVVSTYGTMGGLERLTEKAGGKVVCKASVWLEGPWYYGNDIECIGILPIFVSEEKYERLKELYGSN